MSRALRGLVAVWVVLVWALAATAGSALAATNDMSEVGERAFADVAACVASSDTLLVSVVVDQSGSLQNTDPQNLRVGAVNTVVDALAGLVATADGQVDVEMNLSVFDGGYQEIVGWGSLAGDHAEQLRDTAAEELPRRNTGEFTDYRSALRGAEENLRQRSASVDPDACKVVLWFTDGRFDVGSSTADAVDQLCSPNGVVDSLRGDGVSVIALALFTSTGQGAVSSEDGELLRAVAEGEGEGTTCGTVPVPVNYALGAYLHAADAAALRRVFAGAGTMIEGGHQALTATCPGDDCLDGLFRVPLDPGLSGFRLVLDGVRDEAPPALLSPEGDSAELSGPGQEFAGAELVASTRDGLTVVDLSFPAGGSPGGSWTLDTRVTSERVSVVDLYYFWGATLELRAPEGLVIGETSPLEAVLTYADGTPVDPERFQSLAVRLRVEGEDVVLSPSGPGTFLAQYEVSAQGAPSAVDVSSEAEAVSSPSNVRLGPVTVSSRMSTTLPPAFATLLTSELSMPQIVAEGTTGAPLQFRGSERGQTQVCIDTIRVTGPETAGDIQVKPEQDCVAIDANAEVELPVEVVPEQPGDGRVEGMITLTMTAVDGVDTISVDVPFGASMMRPVNEPLRWALEALLIAGGLLVPVMIAWLTNYWNGTYRVSSRTTTAQKSVMVSASGMASRDGNAVLTIDDFNGLKISGNQRRARLGSGIELRRRLPWWPFGEVKYEAKATSGRGFLLSNREPYTLSGDTAPADSNLRNVFFLNVHVPSEQGDEYAATLLLYDEDDPDLTSVIRRREEQFADTDWSALVTMIDEEIERRHAGSRGQASPVPSEPLATATHKQKQTPVTAEERRPSLWGEASEDDPGPRGRSTETGGQRTGASNPPRRPVRPDDDRDGRPPSIFDD